MRLSTIHVRPAAWLVLTFGSTLTIRVWGISSHFWMLGDQIRDWSIALGPFWTLPLVGPATHFHGYTIGPAFYWILWVIRVVVGPWFENLPHAGGIGQAILHSGADTLLFLAVWRRTQSLWIALAVIVVLATAPYDLCLAGLIWNPMMGSTLAEVATALILLDWPRGSPMRVALTAGIAWAAVQSYTGAVFVALGVFAALLVGPLGRGDRDAVWRNVLLSAAVVLLLQVPYAIHQVSTRFTDSAMGAVTGSVRGILSGTDRPRFVESAVAYAGALAFIQGSPWRAPWLAWVLAACGGIVALRYRRDPAMLAITLLPQLAAIVGYGFFLGDLENYYYLSLMPAAVLTVFLAAAASLPSTQVRVVGMACLIGALAIVPARVQFAATMHRMPAYGVLVEGSRRIVKIGRPMRSIETEFSLPATVDARFIYRILDGRIDRTSPWVAVITSEGLVVYRHLGGS